MLEARRKLEFVNLDPAGKIVSLDMKSLHANVRVNETIDLASRGLYSSDHAPEKSRPTFKKLMKVAVTNVSFKCIDRCFCQVHGIAMGATLAVTLAIIYMKSFEHQIK